MQLRALDLKGFCVGVEGAHKGSDYLCPECFEIVRVREGIRLQRHYYHLRRSKECAQSGKGLCHLQTQKRLLRELPQGEAEMEVRFPEISRIADIAWWPAKVVFEVQCAFMSPKEAKSRSEDYSSIGWQVIWILHDRRYNGRWESSLEGGMRSLPHYFTDIDEDGKGVIYDQVILYKGGHRLLATPKRYVEMILDKTPTIAARVLPDVMRLRQQKWPIHLANDYLSVVQDEVLWSPLLAAERRGAAHCPEISLWRRLFLHPYKVCLQLLLEKYCD